MEQYLKRVEDYKSTVTQASAEIESVLYRHTDESERDPKKLLQCKQTILEALDKYESVCDAFRDFLTRTATEESNYELISSETRRSEFRRDVHRAINELDQVMLKLSEEMIERASAKSVSSKCKSSIRSSVAAKRAEAETAKMKVLFAEKHALLEKKRAVLEETELIERAAQHRKRTILDTEIQLLTCKEQAAIAETEARGLEGQIASQDGLSVRAERLASLPSANPMDKVATYINESYGETEQNNVPQVVKGVTLPHDINTLNAHAPEFHSIFTKQPPMKEEQRHDQQSNLPVDITRFLLKKDLMLSRLTNFNDKPEFYRAWKASFRSVVTDLGTTAAEEIDMLVKYLGPESKRHAASLRTVYVTDPECGLARIWSRIDNQYGAPELVKHAVITKLHSVPRINPREPKKLYELVDILLEVQALKEDPMYSVQLSYFDSSEGILPVVHKLPYNLQERWVSRADTYKRNNLDQFPNFSYFVEFVNDIARVKNDPGLACYMSTDRVNNRGYTNQRYPTTVCKKTEVVKNVGTQKSVFKCPIHKASHSLLDCRVFKEKTVDGRKQIVKDNRICFRCLQSTSHRAADCRVAVKCTVCGSQRHWSLMHDNRGYNLSGVTPQGGEGNVSSFQPHSEGKGGGADEVQAKVICTQVCGKNNAQGRSCAKIVLVDVYEQSKPAERIRTYAIVDEQSNRSLASPVLLDKLGLEGVSTNYTLDTCSGPTQVQGRKVSDCVVEAVDGSCHHTLPPLLECCQIPNARDEIPTQEIASQFPHLQRIASQLPHLDEEADVHLLVGRDLLAAHHVHEQITGKDHEPFAQRLGLGWVIVGQVCLGQMHHQEQVNCKKTYLLPNGRHSLFPPCPNNLKVNESILSIADNLFATTEHDEDLGLSVEDREFLLIMDKDMKKGYEGNWVAPLPFRSDRPRLPNNRAYAVKRASILHGSLAKNPKKLDHFIQFMDQIISRGHAEVAPAIPETKECWYLPLFGVYHPKKPDQVRGVFDASAKFQNLALNDVLLQGPDLLNGLLGILLRFRKDSVAISADIERMFYSFLVDERDRDFLRFFWYEGNDATKDMIEYRMRVHVFGNRPSPAVANFGLKKTAALGEAEFGSDVQKFVTQDFYVDDGLTSKPSVEQAVDLMKRTQSALLKNGNLRLHKIASNEQKVLDAFPQEDLAKDLALLDLSKDYLPIQRSLGLLWDLRSDRFTFSSPDFEKPFTRRGVLSVVNSLYDPLGFVAPVSIVGKVLLKAMTSVNCGWDEPLPEKFLPEWLEWTESLGSLKEVFIPRAYFDHSLSQSSQNTLLVFSDASEKAIASVAYLVSSGPNAVAQVGFLMGKAKVAPSKGHTIPRLELCAAILSVEVAEFVLSQIEVEIRDVRYFTDSRVVLGYICNKKRRFYTYVANRVQRILRSSKSSQWCYINTKHNPADIGTRGSSASQMSECPWLKGPPSKVIADLQSDEENHVLLDPDQDNEIRPDVSCLTTKSVEEDAVLDPSYFQKFSSLARLTRVVSNLHHICRSFNRSCQCSGWHLCPEASSKFSLAQAQNLIIRAFQMESFPSEILCCKQGKSMHKGSAILSLNPFLDEKGVLRVGGRLKHSELPTQEKNPIIVSGKSHLAVLIIRQFHEQILHQGRHLTEGAIRAGGFWITGGKRKVSSYIFGCFQCRRLRGQRQNQIMADLPSDRLTPAPPFTFVGVDVFGPWSVVTRRTRGGQASNKRWAVLFTCLTIRAVDIELVEEMTSSAFINALRRFIARRGNVSEFRSDRGTNFVGSTSELGIEAVNVEDGPIKKLLSDKGATWVFNPPHASHMGGVWERMIGVVRRVLDSLLTGGRLQNLSHDVLSTFMAEVSAIVNSRPIVPVSSDGEAPEILSPSMLLTQKSDPPSAFSEHLSLKDVYRAEWKRVQVLADQFWVRWRSEFLVMLQNRQKWVTAKPNLKVDDVVLFKDETTSRNQWPTALIVDVFPSSDSKVRSVRVKLMKGDKPCYLVRPVTELVLLHSE